MGSAKVQHSVIYKRYRASAGGIMNRGWIVELEPGVYKADSSGRTLVIDNARRYKTISAATHGLAMMRYFSHFINARIYHDDHIEAEPAREES